MSRLSGPFKGFSPSPPGGASPSLLEESRDCFQSFLASASGPGPLAPSFFYSPSLNSAGEGSFLHRLQSSSPQGQSNPFTGFINSSGLSPEGFSNNHAGPIINPFPISSSPEPSSFKQSDTLTITQGKSLKAAGKQPATIPRTP